MGSLCNDAVLTRQNFKRSSTSSSSGQTAEMTEVLALATHSTSRIFSTPEEISILPHLAATGTVRSAVLESPCTNGKICISPPTYARMRGSQRWSHLLCVPWFLKSSPGNFPTMSGDTTESCFK